VQDSPGGRLGVSTELLSQPSSPRLVRPLPDPVDAPSAEVVEDSLPRRELAREHAPLAAALQEVEDGVNDLARAMNTRAASSLLGREVRLQQRPFSI
jgi:hypothetical protein